MLASELQKSRLDQALTKRLIKSVEYLDPSIRNDALLSLTNNLKTLYPVFPTVMLLLRASIQSVEESTRSHIFGVLRDLIKEGSYITKVPVNLAFAVRVLGFDPSDESDEVLAQTYRDTTSMLLRRDLILIMARRDADYWVSERRKHFYALTPWERRSLIVASYILEDEGKHWRDSIRSELTPMDKLVMDWAAEKKQLANWEIPV